MPSCDLGLDDETQLQKVPASAPQLNKDSLYTDMETEELVKGKMNMVHKMKNKKRTSSSNNNNKIEKKIKNENDDVDR